MSTFVSPGGRTLDGGDMIPPVMLWPRAVALNSSRLQNNCTYNWKREGTASSRADPEADLLNGTTESRAVPETANLELSNISIRLTAFSLFRCSCSPELSASCPHQMLAPQQPPSARRAIHVVRSTPSRDQWECVPPRHSGPPSRSCLVPRPDHID